MRFHFRTLIPAGLVLLAAACSPAFPAAQPAAGTDQEQVVPDTVTDSAVPAPLDPTDLSGDVMTGPTDLPSAGDPPPPTIAAATETAAPVAEADCPSNSNLQATNPATVALASGEVQLVEFFAFW